MVSHWNFSDSKSPQVSRTLLSILPDFNAVGLMVSTYPLICKFSSPLNESFGIVLRTQLSIGFSVTTTIRSFLSSLAMSWFLFLFSFSFIFLSGPPVLKNLLFGRFFFFVDSHKSWTRLIAFHIALIPMGKV